jgi:glucosamine-6-phosphate deaminase
MRVHRFDSPADAAAALAARVAGDIRREPSLVLGLPAGRTMVPVYARLRETRRRGALDVSQISTFAVDEFIGLAGGQGSFKQFLLRELLEDFDLAPGRTHFLDGDAAVERECARYEQAIAAAGGIGLQLLGIGRNGHIGFNEPGPSLHARTHSVVLRDETRIANAVWFDGEAARVPRQAVSMGMATLLGARAIALIATGADKSEAVARAIDGPITTEVPASFLQLHDDVDVYLDHAAASHLQR